MTLGSIEPHVAHRQPSAHIGRDTRSFTDSTPQAKWLRPTNVRPSHNRNTDTGGSSMIDAVVHRQDHGADK